ncbi:MAG: hypothetical protein GEU89_19380 [Kiloniellaceae bacterium]|nr:hypothetical protein [Kiloniellaceae bacterium]
MTKTAAAALIASMFLVTGCQALVGGAVGAGATGGGYEVHMNNQKNRVQEDFDKGRITKEEYTIRMNQIQRDSFIQ